MIGILAERTADWNGENQWFKCLENHIIHTNEVTFSQDFSFFQSKLIQKHFSFTIQCFSLICETRAFFFYFDAMSDRAKHYGSFLDREPTYLYIIKLSRSASLTGSSGALFNSTQNSI